jgi:hypothetical protein
VKGTEEGGREREGGRETCLVISFGTSVGLF